MAHDFPSEDWIKAWEQAVNESEEYAEQAAGWGVDFDGDMIFHLVADDRLPEDRYFLVELEDGSASNCREVESPDEVDYGFVYRGDYSDWVRLNEGEIGAIDGLMSGTFDLDGDMQRVLQYSTAAALLVEISSEIDSNYLY